VYIAGEQVETVVVDVVAAAVEEAPVFVDAKKMSSKIPKERG